jgi:hypothetical protein
MALLDKGRPWRNAAAGGALFGAMMIGGSAVTGSLTVASVLINLFFAALLILFLGSLLPRITDRSRRH